jgi:hypothetical protein
VLKSLQQLPDLQETAVGPHQSALVSEVVSSATEQSAGSGRRSERVRKAVSILLIGSDAQGKSFIEETETVLLSRHGASIVSARKLAAEQELLLVDRERNQEAPIRVIGQVGAERNSYLYGIAFLDSKTEFWGISFSVPGEAVSSGQRSEIECGLCAHSEQAGSSDFESEVCNSADGLLRYCKRCGSTTRWKLALATNPRKVVKAQPVTTQPSRRRPSGNRRCDVRVKVNFLVLIRAYGENDVAVCENISRGGLCFRTGHRYFENTEIEVAAPYSSRADMVLLPATIVHVHQLTEDQTFRCGARYLAGDETFVGAVA